jgi:hypothetical protein
MPNVQPVRQGSKLDYSHNWSAWLVDGDTIASHAWAISPTGPVLTNETSSTVNVEGFTVGTVYRLTETIVTAAGRTGVREIVLKVID